METTTMMRLKPFRKRLLVLALVLVGLTLLVTLPFALFNLLFFLFREVSPFLFVPGVVLYLFGCCGVVGLARLSSWTAHRPSSPLHLPSVALLAGGAVVAILVGQLLLTDAVAPLFWPFFVLAAALPPLAALAFASQRLGPVTAWRRALAGVLSGSLL